MNAKWYRIPMTFGIAAALTMAPASFAQERDLQEEQPNRQGQAEETKTMSVHRASKVIGLKVQNRQGEELGEIEDLVFDSATGRLRYTAVARGGFLELGEKLHAVPWEAMTMSQNAEGEKIVVLDVEKEKFARSPGFDDDNWPDFASDEFTTRVESFYRPITEKKQKDAGDSGVREPAPRTEQK